MYSLIECRIKRRIDLPLKFLSIFGGTLEISLINCKISFDLTWSANCVIYKRDRVTTLAITDIKLYVPVVTLSTQYKAALTFKLRI